MYNNFIKKVRYVIFKEISEPFYSLFRKKIKQLKIKEVDRIKKYSVLEYAEHIIKSPAHIHVSLTHIHVSLVHIHVSPACRFGYAERIPEFRGFRVLHCALNLITKGLHKKTTASAIADTVVFGGYRSGRLFVRLGFGIFFQ
jgi:hypothetical protein